MTDQERLTIARSTTDYTLWASVAVMEHEADTPEARRELHLIASHLYRLEEYYAGEL